MCRTETLDKPRLLNYIRLWCAATGYMIVISELFVCNILLFGCHERLGIDPKVITMERNNRETPVLAHTYQQAISALKQRLKC